MKITKLFFAFAIITIAFASCKKTSDELTNAIPSNAPYVIHFDTKSLIQKSNYDIFENVTVSRAVKMAQAFLSKKEAVDMLDAFTKDANALGINLKGDCYMYTDYISYGIVFGINNAEKLKSALTDFSVAEEEDIVAENGIYTFTLAKDIVFGWNKDKLLILGQMNTSRYHSEGKEDIKLTDLIKKQLTQGKKESINSNPAFVNFMKEKKDITVFYAYSKNNFELMEKMSGMDFPDEVKKEIEELAGVSAIASVSFEKGEIKTEGKMFYETSDIEKKYKELVSQTMGELKGDQLKYIPENSIFMVSANIKGEGIYNYLEKLKITDQIEERDEEGMFKTVINNIDGELTFALTNVVNVTKSYSYGDNNTYEYESVAPEYALLFECKDPGKMIELAKGEMGLEEKDVTEIAANTYSMVQGGMTQYFGVMDKSLYLTNNESIFNNLKDKKGQSNKYESVAKGNVAIMGGTIKPLKEIAAKEINDAQGAIVVNKLIDMVDEYSLVTKKDMTGGGKIEMTDKSKNSMETICLFLDETLTILSDQLRF